MAETVIIIGLIVIFAIRELKEFVMVLNNHNDQPKSVKHANVSINFRSEQSE
ncbi:MAG: hypothetical protein IJA10_10535 [Lachnospiraceae bacterium]|nr:hypothetical protein [Lachnospiraceae bacterium]